VKQFLKKSALRSASCLQAVAIIGVGTVGAAAISTPAFAQDYTSGAISGTVTDESGNAVSGATVTVTSTAQGFTRTVTTSANGAFRVSGLQTGAYDVVVTASGQDTYTATGVSVLASQAVNLSIPLTTTGSEIIVTGAQIPVDFAGTTTGATIDVADLVKNAPIGRDLTSIVLLAPGTTTGDDGFTSNGNALPSIGGSSVAENAYYLNGLNTTNFDNYLGSARVPFEFYRTVDIKSGGYSAEFGRATGGIVNAVSKAGSNEFTGAVHLNWEPNFLRSDATDLQNCGYDGLTLECDDLTNRSFDRTENYSAIIEAGGPIFKDRLFVYGLVEFRKSETLRNSRNANLGTERISDDPFWAVKVDAYPIDNHHLEFTMFDTRSTERRSDYTYSELDGVASLGAAASIVENRSGGLNFVGQYTGTITDWLTVSAAYGKVRDKFETVGVDAGSSTYFYQNASGGTVNGVPQAGLYTGQPLSSRDFPYKTEREFYRGDIDLFFNALGDHHLRFGFDLEKNTLEHTAVRNGAADLLALGWLTQEAVDANFGGAGASIILRPGNVVEVNYFNSGGAFNAENKAFYIQDEWRPTERLTLNLGLRRDDFELSKPGGAAYITLEENYAPRIGATYDLWEDSSGKLKAFYGQYFLPVASNTAFRQASPELYIRERYNYVGFDAQTGLPNVVSQVTNNASYQGDCPIALTPFSSGQYCNVTGDGTVKPTDASLSSTLKATKETEWIVGYEHNFRDILGGIKLGLTYTHRSMDVSAEDVAVDAAVLAYCEANGLTGCSSTWTGFHQYVVINPGFDATFALAGQDGRVVTISAEDLGYPKAKRTYDAVEFTFDRPWDGKWMLGGSYTWSKSKGNSEGFVQSDFEQDDSGITQDFDQPGFTQGADGYLPNDRRHRFKLWGAYALTDWFTIGTTARVESPRSLSCFGYNPNPNYFDQGGDPYSDFGNAYGAASHYCGTGSLALDEDGVAYYSDSALSPRGQGNKTGWYSSFDISARVNLDIAGRTLTLRGDVFNVFNAQAVMGRNELGDQDMHFSDPDLPADGVTPNPNYGIATSYQTPRYVRLGVDIAF
jgi:outer membrane receptor protein involved in Fe transport